MAASTTSTAAPYSPTASTTHKASSTVSCSSADPAPLTIESFNDLYMPTELLRRVYEYGFERPSNIQARALPALLRGQSALISDYAGRGKTAACVLAVLSRVNFDENTPQALILLPAREIAMATAALVTSLGLHLGARVSTLVGGVSIRDHIRELQERRPQILCATPGRFMDMVERNIVQIGSISTVVIDELDAAIDTGFEEMIDNVLTRLRPNNVQLILSTSTTQADVAQFIDSHLVDGERFAPLPPALFESVLHYRVDCEERFKMETLGDVLEETRHQRPLVYCNTQQTVIAIGEYLVQHDITDVALIHSGVPLPERMRIFRDQRILTIITSIPLEPIGRESPPGSQIIVNYDMPDTPEGYAARVGRHDQQRPRNLRRKLAISIVGPADNPRLTAIETRYQITAPELPMNFQDMI